MWPRNWREQLPATLARDWDIVIIGGGITGAGILLEAAHGGLRALLVEQRDFAWGTSSRSSKLVHGGLRYLKEGKWLLTRASVRERKRLLRDAAGLVEPQSFAFADYRGRKPGRWLFALGLALYDWMAGQRSRRYYPADEFLLLAPHIARAGLKGGMCYADAKTDDARLVLRVLEEALAAGGVAVNYMAATQVLRADGKVCGVELQDAAGAATYRVKVKVLVNATGAWANDLRPNAAAGPRLRPLRGSHLLLPAWRLPVAQAVSLMHPRDGRPVFAFPWEGVTLVGTTDVDHAAGMNQEAAITPDEVAYLMQALEFQFPELGLGLDDIVATFAGVRPVIDSGNTDPSKEARDHAIWLEHGLLTVTGGKLTTFRLIARDALAHCAALLPKLRSRAKAALNLVGSDSLVEHPALTAAQARRLGGRYGVHAAALLAAAQGGELDTIAGSETLWVELRWAARAEAVMHLEDLLLRRTRLGLQLRQGGAELLPRIRAICQAELGWDDQRWVREEAAFRSLWLRHYSLPPRDAIPDWQAAAEPG
ncbi:MAG: glycerol-3-phosphate dehydrogenase/oxidase [Burkholderiales bacterium]